MMKKTVLAVGLLVVLGLAPAARAVPVEVDYAVTGIITLPALSLALGTLSGTSRLRFNNATASGNAIGSGAARVVSFLAGGPLSFNVLGAAQFVGSANANVIGGSPNGALTANNITLPFHGTATGQIVCTGACMTLASIPPSVTLPITLPFNTILANLVSGANGNPNNGTVTLHGGFGTFSSLPVTVQLTLTEIGRTVVPEPGTASLVWLGLVGLAGVRRYARRRG